MLKMVLEGKINARAIWVSFFLLFKDKIMFKSHFIKSTQRVLRETKADTYGIPVLHRIMARLF
jgi:hypothetical protein